MSYIPALLDPNPQASRLTKLPREREHNLGLVKRRARQDLPLDARVPRALDDGREVVLVLLLAVVRAAEHAVPEVDGDVCDQLEMGVGGVPMNCILAAVE